MAIKKISCSISINRLLLESVDRYAADVEESRSVVIEQFVRDGFKRLERAGAWPRKPMDAK